MNLFFTKSIIFYEAIKTHIFKIVHFIIVGLKSLSAEWYRGSKVTVKDYRSGKSIIVKENTSISLIMNVHVVMLSHFECCVSENEQADFFICSEMMKHCHF